MSPPAFPWHRLPGLAGGIDKDGSRAGELLTLGFGSVEFGTVAPHPEGNSSLDLLVQRLTALPPRQPGGAAIGIGLGLAPDTLPADLPATWLAGLAGAWPVADYLSFNLSARAYRPLLAGEYLPLLAGALKAVTAARERLPRRIPLALKLPLGGEEEALPAVAEAAADAGFDMVTAVLPEAGEGFARLAALARRLECWDGGPALVAVGGIRSATDVRTALAAGASGVQVHRLFVEQGAACLPLLGEGLPR